MLSSITEVVVIVRVKDKTPLFNVLDMLELILKLGGGDFFSLFVAQFPRVVKLFFSPFESNVEGYFWRKALRMKTFGAIQRSL